VEGKKTSGLPLQTLLNNFLPMKAMETLLEIQEEIIVYEDGMGEFVEVIEMEWLHPQDIHTEYL